MKVWRTLPVVSTCLMALASIVLGAAILGAHAISSTHAAWLLRTVVLVAAAGAAIAWFDRLWRLHRQVKAAADSGGVIQERTLRLALTALVPVVLIGFALTFIAQDF